VSLNWKKLTLKELAIIVSEKLESKRIYAVLVGGACVSIYSNNKYQSINLDYISPDSIEDIEKAMSELGFLRSNDYRHFERADCPFFVEFPPGPVAIGEEVDIKRYNTIKKLKLLTPTDSVKDRLAAFYHWNDVQSLEQALMVTRAQKIDLNEIKKWSKGEKALDKYERFESLLNRKLK
jgi:hypothetical protein